MRQPHTSLSAVILAGGGQKERGGVLMYHSILHLKNFIAKVNKLWIMSYN